MIPSKRPSSDVTSATATSSTSTTTTSTGNTPNKEGLATHPSKKKYHGMQSSSMSSPASEELITVTSPPLIHHTNDTGGGSLMKFGFQLGGSISSWCPSDPEFKFVLELCNEVDVLEPIDPKQVQHALHLQNNLRKLAHDADNSEDIEKVEGILMEVTKINDELEILKSSLTEKKILIQKVSSAQMRAKQACQYWKVSNVPLFCEWKKVVIAANKLLKEVNDVAPRNDNQTAKFSVKLQVVQ